jgi:exodeoxyribonuclease VIII
MDSHMTGLVYGLANSEYHSIPALSASGLKLLAKTPFHYRNRPTKPPTSAMFAGTLAHCAILESSEFFSRYVIRPAEIDLRTKDGKAWMASVPAGMEVITEEQARTARMQELAVHEMPAIAPLLAVGQPEVSAFWVDEQTGERCKCRPDWVHTVEGGVILLDVKTATDASPSGFQRAMWNFRYDLQAAWYSDGFEKASGVPVLAFVFVVVESDAPHAAAAYCLSDETMAAAREDNRRLLDLYAECKRTDTWPGYPTSIGILNRPAWANAQTKE